MLGIAEHDVRDMDRLWLWRSRSPIMDLDAQSQRAEFPGCARILAWSTT